MNVLGQPSVFTSRFVARAGARVIAERDFTKRNVVPTEQLDALDRASAEAVLNALDGEIQRRGWRRVENGPHWYSRRYRRV